MISQAKIVWVKAWRLIDWLAKLRLFELRHEDWWIAWLAKQRWFELRHKLIDWLIAKHRWFEFRHEWMNELNEWMNEWIYIFPANTTIQLMIDYILQMYMACGVCLEEGLTDQT